MNLPHGQQTRILQLEENLMKIHLMLSCSYRQEQKICIYTYLDIYRVSHTILRNITDLKRSRNERQGSEFFLGKWIL